MTGIPVIPGRDHELRDKYIVVDDLIRHVARDYPQTPLIAYPQDIGSARSYWVFTAGEIDNFVSNAVEVFFAEGLTGPIIQSSAPSVVGLLGRSDFEYVITMFALSRLGYSVLLLSPRLSIHAYKSLVEETKCSTLVSSIHLSKTVDEIMKVSQLKTLRILSKSTFTKSSSMQCESYINKKRSSLSEETAFILHSSGSTGLPKCLRLTHANCLHDFSMGYRLHGLLTLPLYQMHGHSCLYRAMYQRKTCFMYNASLPLTAKYLITALNEAQPEVLLTVPYGLKLLAETSVGVDALRSCKIVSYAGSACPDDLGEHLSASGVTLASTYGLTEVGAILRSDHLEGRKLWNFLRILPAVEAFTWMKPLHDETHELVILDGLKSKTVSNSNDPTNSFHTRDVFVPHSRISGLWKHVGRLDDCVALMNGKKVLPTSIEGRIRQDPRVKEAVVVGVGKMAPGLLIFRSQEAENLSELDYVEAVWSVVSVVNSTEEGHSYIGKELIKSLPAMRAYPQTDKGTIIRAQLYDDFSEEISALYDNVERAENGGLTLEIAGLEDWLLRTLRERLQLHLVNMEQDFFIAGLDSLQVSRMVGIIKSELRLCHISLSTEAIYDSQNVRRLARYLYNSPQRQPITGESTEESGTRIANMIEEYSRFDRHIVQGSRPKYTSVFITGASGFLGSHILAHMLDIPSIARVYCQVRASSASEGHTRLRSALATRRLVPSQEKLEKIRAVLNDIDSSEVPPHLREELSTQVTHIIHCAWPVNFNLPLASFKEHFRKLQNLLHFSLAARNPEPIHLIYCSSISAALNCPSEVPERPLESFGGPTGMGYAESKYVAEKIIQNAVENAGANAIILRIGQIVGDSLHGIWNDDEAIPIMVRSSLTLNALPVMDERCAWLPVDTVARCVIEVARLEIEDEADTDASSLSVAEDYVYNVVNPKTFSWTEDFLPVLRTEGLSFESVSPQTWLQRLHDSDQGGKVNPAIRLLSFWYKEFGLQECPSQGSKRQGMTRKGDLTFDTKLAQMKSMALRNTTDVITGGLAVKIIRV